MKGQDIGYIRVSSADQNTRRQLDGLELDKIFSDHASGASRARPGLETCLEYIREGDTLHVHSIDRLARNLQDLLQLLEVLLGKGVSVRFHKESLVFRGGQDPFQKLQLQIIGAVAEFERDMIRERQREGIAKAKSEGRRLGRPTKLGDSEIGKAWEMIQAGASKASVARALGVSRTALYRVLDRGKEQHRRS